MDFISSWIDFNSITNVSNENMMNSLIEWLAAASVVSASQDQDQTRAESDSDKRTRNHETISCNK